MLFLNEIHEEIQFGENIRGCLPVFGFKNQSFNGTLRIIFKTFDIELFGRIFHQVHLFDAFNQSFRIFGAVSVEDLIENSI